MAATLSVNLVYPGSPASTQVHPLTDLNGMDSPSMAVIMVYPLMVENTS